MRHDVQECYRRYISSIFEKGIKQSVGNKTISSITPLWDTTIFDHSTSSVFTIGNKIPISLACRRYCLVTVRKNAHEPDKLESRKRNNRHLLTAGNQSWQSESPPLPISFTLLPHLSPPLPKKKLYQLMVHWKLTMRFNGSLVQTVNSSAMMIGSFIVASVWLEGKNARLFF